MIGRQPQFKCEAFHKIFACSSYSPLLSCSSSFIKWSLCVGLARMCTFPVIIIVCVERISIIFFFTFSLLFYVYLLGRHTELWLWLRLRRPLLLLCVFRSVFILLFKIDFVEWFCFPFFLASFALNSISFMFPNIWLTHKCALDDCFHYTTPELVLLIFRFCYFFSCFFWFCFVSFRLNIFSLCVSKLNINNNKTPLCDEN